MPPKPVFFILGPQGSGKSTQAKILAQKFDLFYWEMGDILRELGQGNTPLGKQVRELTDQGVLLSDEMIIEVAKQKLHELPSDRGIIFSGIPRRTGQGVFLLEYLRSNGWTNLITLYIDVPRAEGVKRLLLRANAEHRVDDTPEAIDFRLKQFEEAIAPVVEHLKVSTRFITIDGTPPIPEVTREIDEALAHIE